MRVCADLHLHTTASDGTLRPGELVRRAAALGFTHIAVTDHDTVAGLKEAGEAAQSAGITLINGIELSCGAGKEIHVLGYGFETDCVLLKAYCERRRAERFERAARMVEKLAENGIEIQLDRVLAFAGGVPGRPHVGRAMVEAGHVRSMQEAFERYLCPGRCAYVSKKEFTVQQAAALLGQAGGIAVLAHPMQLKWSHAALDSIIGEWAGSGLMGVEVYHPSADAGDVAALCGIVSRHGLLTTGGSDYHGVEVKPDIAIGQGLERWHTQERDVPRLLACISKRKER